MEALGTLFNLLVHVDEHLKLFIQNYGSWTYLLLFVIIFCETGLVVTPFLPGDSLLFAAGALAVFGGLEIIWLLGLLIAAAVAGDTLNYWLGYYIGDHAVQGRLPFIKRAHLIRTQYFYDRHGGKTIILARFIPIIRTFAPFVAGLGCMNYSRFIIYNLIGGVIWVTLFLLGGFFFGNLPIVQHNFSLVVVAIIMLSLIPMAYELIKHKMRSSHSVA